MLTHGGKAAEEAITGSERRFHVQVIVDWARDGKYQHWLSNISTWVESVTTDRSLSGSMPEELMLVEGASAAEMTVRLGGTPLGGMSWVSVLSPYNGNSPFYMQDIEGVEIKYRLGVETALGIVWYQQFVGNIRTITPDRGADEVEITALDRVELLRRPVRFPPWAISQYHTARGIVKAQLANSQWVIDHCLRSSDISPTPYRWIYPEEMEVYPGSPGDGCVFWLTGTGSYNPTIGWHARTHLNDYPEIDDAPYGMYEQRGLQHPAVAGEDPPPLNFISTPSPPHVGSIDRTSGYWIPNRNNARAYGTHYMGMTLSLSGINSDHPYTMDGRYIFRVELKDNLLFQIKCNQGNIWVDLTNLGTGITKESPHLPLPTGVDHCEVRVAWRLTPAGSQDRVHFRVGNQSTGVVEVGDTGEPDLTFNPESGLVIINNDIAFNDAYYTFRWVSDIYTGPHPLGGEPVPAKYAAVLDKGLQDFSFLPVRDGDDAWDVITQVAAAELGSVFWDEDGVFRFWNAERMLNKKDEVVRTLTLDDVSGLNMTRSLDSVRNIWSVEMSKRIATYGVVYAAKDVDEFYVPGYTEREFRIWADDAIAIDPYKVRRYKGSEWHRDIVHGYVVQFLIGGTWQERDTFVSGVDINTYYTDTGEFIVRVWNGYEYPARLAVDDNTPALTLGGVRAEEFPSQVVTFSDQNSIEKYGARNYKLSGDWVQDKFSAEALNKYLLSRTVEPIPTTDAIEIAGDPRLQLGDTIEVLDPDGFGERMRLQILGIRREYSRDGGLTDTLTVELVRPAGIGLWDSPQYGRWDETFIWSD